MREFAAAWLAIGALAAGPARAEKKSAAGDRSAWIAAFVKGDPAASAAAPSAAALAPSDCAAVLAVARKQLTEVKTYDPAYVGLKFPMGDVPADTGVCADVVVRSLRALKVDLQALIFADRKAHPAEYPPLWGVKPPDKNIDHRRVVNLMVYFRKHHHSRPRSSRPEDYAPCDVVAWDLGGGLTHIGLVSDKRDGPRPLVIHHIGGVPLEEDVLFDWKVIGHFALKREK